MVFFPFVCNQVERLGFRALEERGVAFFGAWLLPALLQVAAWLVRLGIVLGLLRLRIAEMALEVEMAGLEGRFQVRDLLGVAQVELLV